MKKGTGVTRDPRVQHATQSSTNVRDRCGLKRLALLALALSLAACGGGGGGGGMGSGRGPGGPRVFTLDGKEVTAEAPGGNNTTKSTWSSDGKTLELSAIRTGSRDGNDFKFTTVEKLSLSGDGKVLTDVRHNEGPRGTNDSTLVFNKQ